MFKPYNPENSIPNVFYIKDDETGIDWYDFLTTLDSDNIKIAVDGQNIVRFAFTDPDSVFPVNCNVIIPENIPSEFIENPMGWTYIDGKFIHIQDTEFYKDKVEKRELDALKDEYRELRLQSDLGIISNESLIRMKKVNDILVKKYQK